MKKSKVKTVQVPNYGDDWINRLAIIEATIQEMGGDEFRASMRFLMSKYKLVLEDN